MSDDRKTLPPQRVQCWGGPAPIAQVVVAPDGVVLYHRHDGDVFTCREPVEVKWA